MYNDDNDDDDDDDTKDDDCALVEGMIHEVGRGSCEKSKLCALPCNSRRQCPSAMK